MGMLAEVFIAGSAWSAVDDHIIQVDTDNNGTGTFQVEDFNGGSATVTTIQSDAQSTTIQDPLATALL
jgi:hypothetical protein